ncbi:MAG: glutathione S-transferase, partial [Acinetobacter sp.]|nr:glutathione S-transferase [Acinetobacter sp.]
MITLHYLQCSRSFRILWALEELGVDYQVEFYQRSASYAAPEILKNIHPLGKAPILVDDGDVIVESAVILDYLQQQYDRLQ